MIKQKHKQDLAKLILLPLWRMIVPKMQPIQRRLISFAWCVIKFIVIYLYLTIHLLLLFPVTLGEKEGVLEKGWRLFYGVGTLILVDITSSVHRIMIL